MDDRFKSIVNNMLTIIDNNKLIAIHVEKPCEYDMQS